MLKVYTNLLLLFIILFGCTPVIPETSYDISDDLAKSFLQEHGYNIIRYEGNKKMKMTRDFIEEHEVQLSWQLLREDPLSLIDKEINMQVFQVTDHVLDMLSEYDKTKIEVWIVDGEIVGGTSKPITDIGGNLIEVAHQYTIYGERIGYKVKNGTIVNGLLRNL
ncbi:hypothetical protein [Mangrovibacillus cuniculi]|uniref:Lipoprotein n=1 Tax=Mangrovibacillus cuniculi TaxID=2593652 RepID=A0A7S8CDU5_9BACI|nr:hypothetical protein [Mangrovibacillus cuniculi]QPC48153.1 hypothetical protein G8O30_15045 [Mangrovibacillus cuniculi]